MTTTNKDEPTHRSRHREMLIICALVVTAAPLLQVLPNERVALRGVERAVLPPSCPSREFFNVSCPGCGLTRSFVYMARAEWTDSVRCNRVGWVLLAIILVQIPYRLHAMYGSGRFVIGKTASKWFGISVIALLVGNWVFGLLARSGV